MNQPTTTVPEDLIFEPKLVAKAFEYIEDKWSELTLSQSVDDGTLIGLPYRFVVPSRSNEANSEFSFEEMYYWDSYFIGVGLQATGHDDLTEGMLENLLFMLRRYHIIPNASRTYFTGRTQPPLLTSYIFDIYENQAKSKAWLHEKLEIAEREYRTVWTHSKHPNWRQVFEGLSRYYDVNLLDELAEAESGWDMTTRFQGKCLSFLPVDLNSLLYKYEMDFARGAEIRGDDDEASLWKEHARKRRKNVTKYLWNEKDGLFYDFEYITLQHSDVKSLANFYTLWSGLATKEQAEKIVKNLPKFMHRGGLVTTMHQDEFLGDTPTQWAYPNGWAPLQWIAVTGLTRYGYDKEAEVVARTWLRNNLEHFERNKVFREAYNVVSPELPPKPGLYPPQLGFGWTNAVFVDLAKKFLNDEELKYV